MTFWRILNCVFRCAKSWDPRPHKDDVYDDQGNVFVFGQWLDQAMVVFNIVPVLLGIIAFGFSFLDIANPYVLVWIFLSLYLLLPPLFSAVYVAIKRMVFLKKQKQQKDE